jgi:hypothetical protein
MPLSKTTKLEAINTMLSVVGEPPINTLDTVSRVDVVTALAILTETLKEVQSQGWHFNSDDNVPLIPDANGYIQIPDNIVRVDMTDEVYGKDLTIRANKVYNKSTLNDVWPAQTILKCSVVYMFDFEELPETVRRYVVIRAARIFNDRVVGDQLHHAFTAQDEMAALAALKEFDGETADNSIFDSYNIGAIVNRPSITSRLS